ncbi:hypothetical protein MNBD_GAMMA09-3144 [hydrothermal vent metagenome]|uniref:SPOR domain-containing protein n=1 Tax=hydrothermal vent metagenome TaxID=652676 RepID=A0A3B0YI43_9ZZZZ
MKTYLISQDQVKQYLLVLIAVILAVFFLGYYTGAQLSAPFDTLKQTVIPGTDKQSVTNNSPLMTESSTENNKKQDIKTEDTKKAEQKALDKKKADKKKAEQKKADKIKADKRKADKKRADKRKADRKKADKIKADKKKKQEQAAKKAEEESLKETTASPSSINNMTSAASGQKQTSRTITPETTPGATAEPVALPPGTSADDIAGIKRYYSVQAGMFASKVNAASFIDRLAEKNFEAYVSDFVSTSGAVKYNVRVGRFEERDQARELLRKFQKSFSSPAYVVITN